MNLPQGALRARVVLRSTRVWETKLKNTLEDLRSETCFSSKICPSSLGLDEQRLQQGSTMKLYQPEALVILLTSHPSRFRLLSPGPTSSCFRGHPCRSNTIESVSWQRASRTRSALAREDFESAWSRESLSICQWRLLNPGQWSCQGVFPHHSPPSVYIQRSFWKLLPTATYETHVKPSILWDKRLRRRWNDPVQTRFVRGWPWHDPCASGWCWLCAGCAIERTIGFSANRATAN